MPQRKSVNIKVEWIADILWFALNIFFQIRLKQGFLNLLFVWQCPVPCLQAGEIGPLASVHANSSGDTDRDVHFREEPHRIGNVGGSGAAPLWIVQLQTRATYLRTDKHDACPNSAVRRQSYNGIFT